MRIRHNLKKVTQNFNEYKPKIKITLMKYKTKPEDKYNDE